MHKLSRQSHLFSVGGYNSHSSSLSLISLTARAKTSFFQVPIVILKTKDMRNSTNIFLINLSVADLLVLLVCTPTVLGNHSVSAVECRARAPSKITFHCHSFNFLPVEVNTAPETWVLGEHMCKLQTALKGLSKDFPSTSTPAHASAIVIRICSHLHLRSAEAVITLFIR